MQLAVGEWDTSQFHTSTPTFIKSHNNSCHFTPSQVTAHQGFAGFFYRNMGSRMFLLSVLVLLLLAEHSHGVPDTQKRCLIDSTSTDAFTVGQILTTANPVDTPMQHNRPCNCKGKRRETGTARCLCQQFARRNGRHEKFTTLCQMKKYKNSKKCRLFSKAKKSGKTMKMSPSVPI